MIFTCISTKSLCLVFILCLYFANGQERNWRASLVRRNNAGDVFFNTSGTDGGGSSGSTSSSSSGNCLFGQIFVPPCRCKVWVDGDIKWRKTVSKPTKKTIQICGSPSSIAVEVVLDKHWFERQIPLVCANIDDYEGSGDLETSYVFDLNSETKPSDKDPLGLDISGKNNRWESSTNKSRNGTFLKDAADMNAVEDEIAREFFAEPQEYAAGTAEMYKHDKCLPIGFNMFVESKVGYNSGNNWVCESYVRRKYRETWFKKAFRTLGWSQPYKPNPAWKKLFLTQGSLSHTGLFTDAESIWTWNSNLVRPSVFTPSLLRKDGVLTGFKKKVIPRKAYCRVDISPSFSTVERGGGK